MKRISSLTYLARLLGAGAVLAAASDVSAAPGTPNHVRDVRVKAEGGSTEVEVVGTQAPVYVVRAMDGGRRLQIDLSSADVMGAPMALNPTAGLVGGVLTQAYKSPSGSQTRVVLSLKDDASYRIRPDGDVLRIVLSPKVVGPGAEKPAAAARADRAAVRDLRFERSPEGKDRIVVALDAIPSYTKGIGPTGKLRIELRGTSLPPSLQRTMDVTAYRGNLRSLTASDDKGVAVIEVERSGGGDGELAVEGDKLVWSFDAPDHKQPSPIGKLATRHTATIAREEIPSDVPRVTTNIHDGEDVKVETGGGEQAGFTSTVAAQAAGRYGGRRIDLDLKDADIHNVLRLLADVGKVNIVTADDVSGNITIRMRNVPWDQALDVVLQAKGLGMVRQGNLIRVAPAATLQKERELRLAAAKQELDLAPLETRLIPVSYATAEELQARAKDLLSPRGSIAVDERTNVLIARDVGGNLNHIEELVRALDTQTPQVLVEARIVEATSRYLRDVGIQWGGDVSFGPATGNPTGIAFPSSVGVVGGNYDQNTPTAGLSPFQRVIPNPNFAVNLPAATGTGQGGALGLSFGSIDNSVNLAVRLSAAEASGLVRIVSSPRILTLDNRQARINQGTLIPFAQISAQGVQTTFQEAKLQLLVTPHVTADGSVSMHVKINRDEPDFNQTSARGDPTILKREAETDLLVMDGHTAVIGGIFTRNTGRNLDQVPFFGDIPVLGVLFQRRRASDTRNELVIFITPRIVNRAEALGR
jgi:type IV pilus assembly protein PilQ